MAEWPALDVQKWRVDRLIPFKGNSRLHSDAQIDQIVASIREWGWTTPVLIDDTGMIIAGHARVMAAIRLGLAEVPVAVATGWSADMIRAYVIADNKLTENGAWDDDLLRIELTDLMQSGFDIDLIGFSADELEDLIGGQDDQGEGQGDDQADEEITPPSDPVTVLGDVWKLGGHRLICGDSTDARVVDRVLEGDLASLLFTSPPYGQQRDYTTGGGSDWDALMRGVFVHADIAMADAGQILVNLGMVHRQNEWLPYWDAWIEWMRARRWRRFGLYVWDQGPGLPGDWAGRLAPAFEMVFHFNRKARKPNKIIPCKFAGEITHEVGGMTGLRKTDGTVNTFTHAGVPTQDMKMPDSVLRITRHKGAVGVGDGHPAPFPIALPEFVLRTYTDAGDVVFEPFAGSGSTIIAGERTGRLVRGIELAPIYADVAVMRFRKIFPDVAVTLGETGRTFEEVAADRGVALAAAA